MKPSGLALAHTIRGTCARSQTFGDGRGRLQRALGTLFDAYLQRAISETSLKQSYANRHVIFPRRCSEGAGHTSVPSGSKTVPPPALCH